MSGLILSHDDEGAGLLGEWLTERGCAHELRNVARTGVPALGECSFVASLGSVCSANDSDPDWVPREIELLRMALAAEIPVLGLCFGGQALCVALGGAVAAAARPRVGWFELAQARHGMPSGPWFHWHYEQLSVPPGGEALGQGESGPAAFRHGRNIGVQFHPEVTLEIIDTWSESVDELAALDMSPEALRRESASRAPLARRHAWELFELWWSELGF